MCANRLISLSGVRNHPFCGETISYRPGRGDCKNNSCIDSSNNNLKDASIPWDKSSNTLKSNIVWRSTNHGGTVNSKCHKYYAGNINEINATWGANCVAEPSAFIPGAPIVPPGTSGNPAEK